MAKKFPKSALKEIDVIEGRMILHHWAGVPTEEVINLIMPDKVLAALEEHQECILTGDMDADFLTHLNPDTVAFLQALREYMEGTRPRVPKRADIAETLELGAEGADEEEEQNKEEPEEVTPTAEEKKVALRTRAFGIKAAPEPESEPEEVVAPFDFEGLEAKLDALLEGQAAILDGQEVIRDRLTKMGRILTFLVSEGILEKEAFEDMDALYEAING